MHIELIEGNTNSDEASLYKGTSSDNFSPAITTPAAWVMKFLFRPSNFKESSTNFFTFGLFFSSSLNLGSLAIDSKKT